MSKLLGAFLCVGDLESASFEEDEVAEDGHDDKGKLTNGIVGWFLLLVAGVFEVVVEAVDEGVWHGDDCPFLVSWDGSLEESSHPWTHEPIS